MNFSKPQALLEQHLRKAGLMWASVLDISSWEQFWDIQAAPPELQTDLSFYERWLSEGGHANMAYLQNNLAARKDARKILADVKCIISLIIPYAEGHSVRGGGHKNDTQRDGLIPKIARYARVPDYHRSLKKEIDAVFQS